MLVEHNSMKNNMLHLNFQSFSFHEDIIFLILAIILDNHHLMIVRFSEQSIRQIFDFPFFLSIHLS